MLLVADNERAYSIACRIWDEAEPEHEDVSDLREEWMFAEVLQSVSFTIRENGDAYNTGRDTLADLMSED